MFEYSTELGVLTKMPLIVMGQSDKGTSSGGRRDREVHCLSDLFTLFPINGFLMLFLFVHPTPIHQTCVH